MRAWVNLRFLQKRQSVIEKGLKRHGFEVVNHLPLSGEKISPSDILLTWNRIGAADKIASQFQARGQHVLVMENASFGNDFNGGSWYHIARNYHNTSGCFQPFGADRWNSLNIPLMPFRSNGEVVILPQRGIGSPPVAMPKNWGKLAHRKYGGRIRNHPGQRVARPLDDDLSNAGKVITWGSGAAIKALMMGIPVMSEMPNWIAEQDNTVEGRLKMFQRLIWAQWTLKEIASGFAFDCLLSRCSEVEI